MNYVFFLFFTFLFILILTINDFNILSVSIQSLMLFWTVSAVFLANANGWGVEIGVLTMFLILGSLIFMFLGERFCKKTNAYGVHCVCKLNDDAMFTVKESTVLIVFLFSVIVIFFEYKHVISVAKLAGYAGGEFALNYARKAYLYDSVENNLILSICEYFIIAFGYVNIAFLLRDVVKNGIKTLKRRYVIAILPVIILYILSTGRTGFLQIFMYSISVIIICLYKKNGPVRIYNKKAIKIICAGVVIVGIVFILLGMLTGKTQKVTVLQIIGEYFGSGIAALNEWLKNTYGLNKGSVLFGEETFRSLYQLIGRFININISSAIKEFVHFKNGNSTNVYTAFRDYYSDFGLFGTWIIEFLMGFFLTHLLGKALNEKNVGIRTMTYAYFSYSILRQITAAHFISAYFNIQYMFVYIFMILIMRYMRFE